MLWKLFTLAPASPFLETAFSTAQSLLHRHRTKTARQTDFPQGWSTQGGGGEPVYVNKQSHVTPERPPRPNGLSWCLLTDVRRCALCCFKSHGLAGVLPSEGRFFWCTYLPFILPGELGFELLLALLTVSMRDDFVWDCLPAEESGLLTAPRTLVVLGWNEKCASLSI